MGILESLPAVRQECPTEGLVDAPFGTNSGRCQTFAEYNKNLVKVFLAYPDAPLTRLPVSSLHSEVYL
jgi:hypothetical protein